MKVKFQQFLYQNHSWSVVGWNLARAFHGQKHDIVLVPTDTEKKSHLPDDLKQFETQISDGNFDCQISYTAPINWPHYLSSGTKNRFSIWAYEFNGKNVLPDGFAKYYRFVDKILAPSEFCKDIYLNGKVPEEKIVVVPHGINLKDYENKNKIHINTKKKIKIGLPLGQLHRRKNVKGLLEAYFKAFTQDDDVCLVLKTQSQKQQQKKEASVFDIDFDKTYRNVRGDFPKNRAEVHIIKDFIPDMVEFYNACDIIFTMSNAEGFYMPGLEAMAADKLVIAPRYGGQLDFLSDDNSLLIDGKVVRAPRNYAYWTASPYAEMFKPSVEDAVDKLRYAVANYDSLHAKFSPKMKEQAEKLTWDNVAKQITDLCEV